MLYHRNGFVPAEAVTFGMGVSALQLLERRIAEDGVVLPGGILKVDGFLNHLMDPVLFTEMARELYRLYEGEGVNKILTIEASGIGLACITGQVFGCAVLFAKKNRTSNLSGEFWTSRVYSFTHHVENTILVSKKYLGAGDRVLIVDDFLANGAALDGLITLCLEAGAEVVGAGICIEKAFQPGGERIRSRGVKVESLARIKSMSDDGGIEFC